MSYISLKISIKKKSKRLLLLACLFSLFILSIYFQNNNQGVNGSDTELKNPETNEAPLYHVEWSVMDSSTSNCFDMAMSLSEDLYIICDGIYSGDSMIVKYDKNGNLKWDASIEGEFRGIALDSSNNVYIAGYIPHEFTYGNDMILAKYSSSGVFQWSEIYSVRDYDSAYAVAVDSSNNVYIGGTSWLSGSWPNKDALLVKYSSSGTWLWERFLDLRDEDYISGIATDSSNNVYITGYHRLFSTNNDLFVAKYSSSGNLQWSQDWGSFYDEMGYDIVLDGANNVFITGMIDDPTNHDDLLLLKFNSGGSLQWSRTWSNYGLDRGLSIDLSSDGDIFIGGATYEQSAGLFDILLIVYNSAGTLKGWSRWGGSDHDMGKAIAVTSSKDVYLAGYRDNDFYLLKWDPSPIITINSPVPNQLFSQNSPSFDVDISDPDLINKFYTVNDGTQNYFSSSTGKINQAAWDACPSGDVSLKFYGQDTAGAVYDEVIVRKDLIAPDFEIIFPSHLQVCADISPNYVLSTGDSDVDSIWYKINGGGDFITNSLTGKIDQAAWSSADNGTVSLEFFMRDDAGNIGSKIVEIYKYFENPIIVVNNPLVNEVFGLAAPKYNISISSYWAVDRMWYSINNGENITIEENEGKFNQDIWDLLGNGSVLINFYVNNTLGNPGETNITIYKDIYLPYVEIHTPVESETYGIKSPIYNVTITSTILDSKWYNLNNGENITLMSDVGSIDQSSWSLCPIGTVNLTFYANNTDGVVRFKQIIIQKDIRTPNITIISPAQGFICGIETIDFGLLIEDPTLDKTWYSLNGGSNYSFTGSSGKIDQECWDGCGNGTVLITFYANNSLGNIGYAETYVHKDIYFPFIKINSPAYGQIFGDESPDYNFSISSIDIDTIWYSLNYGENHTVLASYGKIDQIAWELFGTESVIITFYVNNSFGQTNSLNTTVFKNAIRPNITILSPSINEVFGIDTLQYSITIESPNIDSIWYTLNGSSRIFIMELTGTIDNSLWGALGNGTVNIEFFANNSLGNIGSMEVLVHRDIYFPFIDIIDPVSNQYCGILALFYNYTVSTMALDSLWYTINDSAPIAITASEGFLDQQVWEVYGEGDLHIQFWANNTYGQVNFKGVIVIKFTHLIERNAYAIIVGVSNYPGTSSDLNYCDDDADEVYNMLINDYNFHPSNIILIKDTSATKSTIDNAFDTINSVISPNDIFYFYYSGHGGSEIVTSTSNYILNSPHPYPNYYDRTWYITASDAAYIRVHFSDFDIEYGYDYLYLGDTELTQGSYYHSYTGYSTDFWSDWVPVLNDNRIYLRLISDEIVNYYGFRIDQIEVMRYSNPHYLCPYDSIPSSPSNYYLDTLLDAKLDSLNCDNIYAIMDSCNSGGMIPESQGSNRFIMTACRDGQVSYEDPSLRNGIFTYYLVNSLDHTNDQNSDGVISMEEIFAYVNSGTQSYSGSYGPGYRCHPQISDGISGQSVLYPSIGSVNINPIGNQLYYSFYLYGHGSLKTLNLSVCSISPSITFKTEEIKYRYISPTGFGYYEGFIEMEEGYTLGGIELLAEIEGNQLITINLRYGDSDNDGLTDFFEIFDGNGLDPNNNDTDGDGLSDGDELNLYNTNPLEVDSDSDGLTDGEEVNIYGTNPLSTDTDGDGINDYDEIFVYTTDPLLEDSDSDGINDYDEIFVYTTDPLNSDTDLDSVLDGDEINIHLTNPLNNDTDSDGLSDGDEIYVYFTSPLLEDTDQDGLSDFVEIIVYSTDPLDDDTDSDTMPDGWEVINLLDPLLNDTALDPDNDTLSNLLEYQYNTLAQNNDTDSDLLLDGEEVFLYGTNPTLYDTDGDGISDYDEVMIHFTDPLNNDSDSDGISDYDEINIYGTDPLDNDTDSDTMPDGWEIDNLLDPFTNDTILDPDNDFLTNLDEFLYNTLPQDNDTDSDLLLDGEEVLTYGTDPLNNDTDSDDLLDGEEVLTYGTDPLDNDTDLDGLPDGLEVLTHGTNPLSGDTDSDTMPDMWEVDNLLDPLVNDTMLDPDTDALTNIEEFQYNTDPQDSDTDDDGWDDGNEVSQGTNPLDPDDHPNPPPPAIPGYDYFLIFIIATVIFMIFTKKRIRFRF